ncbi:MAG: hypothetical protein KJN98_06360 [Pontiella sp.]|nr:hypothetical protein [Pontiella sp.]
MKLNKYMPLWMVCVSLLAGCVAPQKSEEPVVVEAETMTFLEAGLRPEVLLFPDYLLLEDFELTRHGRIPETSLVGAGMQTKMDLKITHRRLSNVLTAKGWRIDRTEVGSQSYRLMATLDGESLEVRSVKGTGATQVFILYQPNDPMPLQDAVN